MLQYPKDILPTVREAWTTTSFGSQTPPRLPPDAQIRSLLDVAYHASFLTEESRRLSFRIALVGPGDLRKRGPLNSAVPIELDQPIPLSVGAIVSLAPATAHEQVFICVHPRPWKSKASDLQIWGLLDIGASWSRFVRGESEHGTPPPNAFTISSTEPGNLTISRSGYILTVLRAGQLLRPTAGIFGATPVDAFFAASRSELYNEVITELSVDRYDPENHDDSWPDRFFNQYLERLVSNVRIQFHGGSILIVPDTLESDDSRLMDRLNLKYPTDYATVWSLLKKSLVLHRQYYDQHFALHRSKTPLEPAAYRSVSGLEMDYRQVNESIADSVRAVSALSGVDGTILMTTKYRVLGFGAEVTAFSPTLRSVNIASGSGPASRQTVRIANYGTRHRAAFRFCSSFEDAVAIVVSQDGGVKAVKRVGPDVVLWPDVNRGMLGL